MSASELVKSRPSRSSASGAPQYRPIAPVTPIPIVEPPPKAKRGRKPNPGSKSVREALRKESHSRIEKRRREKINETLTTLRELIAQGESDTRQQHSPPPGPEREFKLELLERTVIFVRGLLDKTRALEQELADLKGAPNNELGPEHDSEPPRKRKKIATPSSSPHAGPSHRSSSVIDEDIDLDDSSVLSELEPEPEMESITVPSSPVPNHEATLSTSHAARRSMSIAALLSPSVAPVLPSPPPSGHLKGSTSSSESQMETLSLPSPEVNLNFRRPSVTLLSPTHRPSTSHYDSHEIARTNESDSDDTATAAAALLLQFSSKTPRSMLGMHQV